MESVIKSTINIPAHTREELNRYVALKIIPSFSGGVNAAIEAYLKELRRAEYDRQMSEAAKDKDFIARTLECQKDMAGFEGEVGGEW